MPSRTQYLIVKSQVESFREFGFKTELGNIGFSAKIKLSRNEKQYNFYGPDWDTVSNQLATLYRSVRNKPEGAIFCCYCGDKIFTDLTPVQYLVGCGCPPTCDNCLEH